MKRSMTLWLLSMTTAATLASGCMARDVRALRNVWRDAAGGVYHRVNINTASEDALARLPGLDKDDAKQIIAHRPYGHVQGLVRKNVISRSKYDQVRDYLYAG